KKEAGWGFTDEGVGVVTRWVGRAAELDWPPPAGGARQHATRPRGAPMRGSLLRAWVRRTRAPRAGRPPGGAFLRRPRRWTSPGGAWKLRLHERREGAARRARGARGADPTPRGRLSRGRARDPRLGIRRALRSLRRARRSARRPARGAARHR